MKKLIAFIACCYLCGCVSNSKFQEELILHQNWEDRANALAAELQQIKDRSNQETAALWEQIEVLRNDSMQKASYIRHLELSDSGHKSVALSEDLQEAQIENDSLRQLVAQLQSQLSQPQSLPSSTVVPLVDKESMSIVDSRGISSQMNELEKFVVGKMSDLPTGKAYVRKEEQQLFINLSDQLIFDSGNYKIEYKGIPALSILAEVINKFPDFKVLVIGHTDNVPIRRKNIRDNWDLSVLRASSIVRSLVRDYNFDPTRIIAAGQGEFDPVTKEDSSYARSKNRRIEIVLTHTSMLEGNASL